MPVHVIMGPPCAGKTTAARARGGTVIDLDDIEEELGGERYAARSSVRGAALAERDRRIEAAFGSDEQTWVIHTAPTKDQLAGYLARGASIEVLNPGLEACLERAADRPPHTSAVIRDWYENFPLHSGIPISTRPEPHGDGLPEQGAIMSDTPTPSEPKPAQPNGSAGSTPPEPHGDDEVDYKAKYEETLAHSRQWEQRAKENKDAAERLAQLEDAQKTAEQKQAERVQELERENAGFKAERQQRAWAKEVSTETGVPAEVLRGSTLEEIQAHAELLKPAYEEPEKPGPSPVTTIGQQPASGNVSLKDQIAAAEASGDKALIAALKAQQLAATN